jgi:hypothetical protein
MPVPRATRSRLQADFADTPRGRLLKTKTHWRRLTGTATRQDVSSMGLPRSMGMGNSDGTFPSHVFQVVVVLIIIVSNIAQQGEATVPCVQHLKRFTARCRKGEAAQLITHTHTHTHTHVCERERERELHVQSVVHYTCQSGHQMRALHACLVQLGCPSHA